ncbi:MAG: hypothetical protein WCA46_27850 [Actinocatenispora sp.]
MTSCADILREAEDGPAAAARRLLGEVLDGPGAVHAVRHPLGFTCLPVVRDGPDGVCVHWWRGRNTARLTTEAIHAHSWDLLSFVLYGALRHDTVAVVDDPVAPTHRVFEVRSGRAGWDEIRGTARTVHIGPMRSARNGAGSRYRVRSGEFHANELVEADVATLVFGRTLSGAVDLTLAALDATDHTTKRQTCDAVETRRVARAVLDGLVTG